MKRREPSKMNNVVGDIPEKKYPDHLIPILLLNALILAIEGYFSHQAISGNIAFTTLLLIHLPLCVLAFSIAYAYKKMEWNLSFALLSAISLLFFGALGPLYILGAIFLYLIFGYFTDLPSSYKDLFKIAGKYDLVQTIYERLTYGQDTYNPDKLPTIFLDILVYGTVKQKRIAIDRILRHFRPEFSHSLYKALNDSSNSIRVLAASAVNRLDSQYMQQNHAFEKKYLSNPTDEKYLLNYAFQCESFSRLVFIDDERRQKMRNKAIELFEKYLKQKPTDQQVAVLLAKLYDIRKDYERSASCLEPFIKNPDKATEEVYRWYFSALFQLKRYDEIRMLSKNEELRLRGRSVEYDKIVDQILLWRSGLTSNTITMEETHG